MNHGVWLHPSAGDASDLIDLGIVAERAGWDGVFVSDSLGGYPDPLMVLSGVAANTDQVTLGTWVTPLARRQPWQVAKDLATLDVISNGRVVFGAGLGGGYDWEPYGRSFDTSTVAEQLDESLDVIDGLWREEEFSYDGSHYELREATLQPTPVQNPRIPILLGGWWPNKNPIARGARWDGIMPVGPNYPDQFSEEELRSMMAFYHEQADEPGEVLLGRDYSGTDSAFPDWCDELGVTWLLTTGNEGEVEGARIDEDLIRAGPPT